mmetsp:Transcript_5092/g.8680  ORF Transcript_5092/g.8680 Transcript_5092/m.8680 type:complete len:132 (-) Transcript_5092:139-534(-)
MLTEGELESDPLAIDEDNDDEEGEDEANALPHSDIELGENVVMFEPTKSSSPTVWIFGIFVFSFLISVLCVSCCVFCECFEDGEVDHARMEHPEGLSVERIEGASYLGMSEKERRAEEIKNRIRQNLLDSQ